MAMGDEPDEGTESADPKSITAVRSVEALARASAEEAEGDIDIPVDESSVSDMDDVVIADDLAEMLDADDASPPPPAPEKKAPAEPPPVVKRSVPPPLPRV
jgi:hypothetical protein